MRNPSEIAEVIESISSVTARVNEEAREKMVEWIDVTAIKVRKFTEK